MDLATLIGFVGALGAIAAAIILGGSPAIFFNAPSVLIVLAGTLMAVLIKFPLGQFLGAFKAACERFGIAARPPQGLIDQTVELAQVARDFSPGRPSRSSFTKSAPPSTNLAAPLRFMPSGVAVAPGGQGGLDFIMLNFNRIGISWQRARLLCYVYWRRSRQWIPIGLPLPGMPIHGP
ncbi:MAG: hypothetical protein J5I81_04565 [Nitrococcus mobilis]|nr:hypothetical protein [Nitrococcus mobilis]